MHRQVAQQIRAAQQKAALSGQAPLAWAIGARCQAVWSGDGGWYNGTVSGVSVNDRFIVTFDEDGGVEEVNSEHSEELSYRIHLKTLAIEQFTMRLYLHTHRRICSIRLNCCSSLAAGHRSTPD